MVEQQNKVERPGYLGALLGLFTGKTQIVFDKEYHSDLGKSKVEAATVGSRQSAPVEEQK